MLSCFWNVAFQSSAYLLYVLLTFDVFLVADVQKKCLHSMFCSVLLCFSFALFLFWAICCYACYMFVWNVRWLFSVLLWATLLNLASVGGEWDGASSASLERRDVPPIEGPRGDGSAHPPCAIPSTP